MEHLRHCPQSLPLQRCSRLERRSHRACAPAGGRVRIARQTPLLLLLQQHQSLRCAAQLGRAVRRPPRLRLGQRLLLRRRQWRQRRPLQWGQWRRRERCRWRVQLSQQSRQIKLQEQRSRHQRSRSGAAAQQQRSQQQRQPRRFPRRGGGVARVQRTAMALQQTLWQVQHRQHSRPQHHPQKQRRPQRCHAAQRFQTLLTCSQAVRPSRQRTSSLWWCPRATSVSAPAAASDPTSTAAAASWQKRSKTWLARRLRRSA